MTFKRLVNWLAWLSAFPAAVLAAAEPIYTVPFYLTERGHVIVEGRINDRWDLPLVVDTGAYFALLPEQAPQQLNIPASEIGEVMAMTASDTRPISTITLESLSVGDDRLEAVNAVLTDLPVDRDSGELPGVLPIRFLQRYTVHFNLADRLLEFYDPELPLEQLVPAEGYSTVPIRLHHGFVEMNVSVDGQEIPAILDTGASGSPIINWSAADTLGVGPDHPGLLPSRDIQGAGLAVLSSQRYEFERFEIGGEQLISAEVDIADMPHLRHMLGKGPAVNLGLKNLGPGSLYLSYSQQLISLDVPEGMGESN